MKRFFAITTSLLALATACQQQIEPEEPVVFLPDGVVALQDAQFGMYYGDLNKDGIGVLSVVLSDARCYQDELDKPYMDSEGDMLVLQFRIPLLSDDQEMALPAGAYPVAEDGAVNTIFSSESYVKRMQGTMQSKWDLMSGTVNVSKDEAGLYQISTEDLVVSKDGVVDTLAYVCRSSIKVADYLTEAPAMLGTKDDIIDMPFPDFKMEYYGDLYGNGTGNFVVSMSTKGFVTEEGDVLDVPGVYVTLNFFSRLYTNTDPVLEEGRYTVSAMTADALFSRWSLFPGLLMDGSPFGSYFFQNTADSGGVVEPEFITSGVVDVAYEEDSDTKASYTRNIVLTYTLKSSTRSVSGVWKGEIEVANLAEGATESFLTTLDHDVDCNMDKVTEGVLCFVETLHRENVEPQWNYDIAECWQLYLQPRDWTPDEYAIPWLQDNDNNGISDRLDAYCADGDVMLLEFVLPLEEDLPAGVSRGDIAPEIGKEYLYTLQPNLAATEEMYEIYVSRMGRPNDEVFDDEYARQFPGWADGCNIEGYEYCNSRRGFTWSSDGFRGTWYMHYETGRHQVLDEHAPAVNGWVKVVRTSEDVYDFEWEFIDDNPGTPNVIKGSKKGCKVRKQI